MVGPMHIPGHGMQHHFVLYWPGSTYRALYNLSFKTWSRNIHWSKHNHVLMSFCLVSNRDLVSNDDGAGTAGDTDFFLPKGATAIKRNNMLLKRAQINVGSRP